MTAKDYKTACEKFRESDRLDPAVGTHFNLANCEEQRGRLATAWSLYRQVLEQLREEDPRVAIARDRAQALDARVPRLTIRARGALPPGTTARIAELELEAASFGSPVPLDPGTYAVTITSPGRPPRLFNVTLAAGDAAELGIPADSIPARATTVVSEQRAAASKEVVPERNPVPAYIAGSFGAIALVTGITTGLIGLHQESIGNVNCNDATRTCTEAGHDANEHARSFATVSTIGFITGAVGLGIAGYLWFTLPDNSSSSIGVGPSNQGASLEWRRTW